MTPRGAPGVHHKVQGVLKAAKTDAGFETRVWAEPFSRTAPLRRLAAAIAHAPETHLIVRSLGFANMFLVPALIRARRRGAHVTIDVPSPHYVAVRELWSSRQSLWRRVRTIAATYVAGPWSLWPASRIVQYAPESWWFVSATVAGPSRSATALTWRRSSRAVPLLPGPPTDCALIAVASLARWQGYDRLLHAVRQFLDRPDRTFDVQVTIVGDGPDLAGVARGSPRRCNSSGRSRLRERSPASRCNGCTTSAHLAVSTLGLASQGPGARVRIQGARILRDWHSVHRLRRRS